MQSITKKSVVILLSITFILAMVLRMSGIMYGIPEIFHPDEARIILDSLSMGQRMSLLSEDINYPLLYKYILLVSYGFYFLVGKVIGVFQNQIDFASEILANPYKILILSRAVTAFIGATISLLGFVWGLKIRKSPLIGLLSAGFLAIEWQLVLESQFALHQTLAAFTSLLAFLGINLVLIENKTKNYLIGGFALGMAIASHQTAVLFIPVLIYLILISYRKKTNNKKFIENLLVFFISAAVIGLIGNLNWIFQFKESLSFFLQGSGAGKIAFSSTPFYSYNLPSITLWFIKEIVIWDNLIGLLAIIGIAISLKKHDKIQISYLIILLTYLLFFKNWAFRWMHLFVTLLPITCLSAAEATNEVLCRLKNRGLINLVFLFVLFTPNLLQLVKVNTVKNNLETRQIAKKWIENNIPESSKIAIAWPAYSVPLEADLPSILSNKKAKDYFEKNVSDEIKRLYYQKKAKNGPKYEVTSIVYSTDKPNWPSFMPESEKEKAKKENVYVNLYSYFNFLPLEELKSDGVNYIVLDSYTYGMFLKSDSPNKKHLHNIYMKDNILSFNNHNGLISKGTPNELLYYLSKEGREYFQSILQEQGFTLIKEFYPSNNNLGPVVKIFTIDK